MPVKTVAVIGAACLTAGWLLAAVLTPPVASVQSLRERRGASGGTGEQAPEAVVRVRPVERSFEVAPPAAGRNPFVFGARRRAAEAGPGPVALPAVEPPVAVVPAPPARPLYSLSGIAVTRTPDGDVRTAVLSDGRTVHLLTAGDTIGTYRVLDVGDTSVTLESDEGVRTTLHLR